MSCASLAKKLETFASQLDHEELNHFKAILERGGMTEAQLKNERPGKIGNTSLAARAGHLNEAFFLRLCDW